VLFAIEITECQTYFLPCLMHLMIDDVSG